MLRPFLTKIISSTKNSTQSLARASSQLVNHTTPSELASKKKPPKSSIHPLLQWTKNPQTVTVHIKILFKGHTK